MARGMTEAAFITASDTDALAEQLAHDVVECLEEGLHARGHASLVVSGGSTPLPFFKALRGKPIDWQNITVTLADERWVASDHADSNARFVREHLLQDKAASARFVPLYHDMAITEAAVHCHNLIAPLTPFDCVVLGMGSDGHTASLFPATPGLAEAVDLSRDPLCCAMFPPSVPQARMSLTLKALVNTRKIAVHITSDQKRQVLAEAQLEKSVERAPISAVDCSCDPLAMAVCPGASPLDL